MRFSAILFFFFMSAGLAIADDREETICGPTQERFLFWLWSSIASEPDKTRALISPFIEPIEFTTSDGKTLHGYKYNSHNVKEQKILAKGYVLMALGNAMIANQIIPTTRYLSILGYDVYIYDYRGYGNSEGKRRIKAIIEDYKEIIAFLNPNYDKRLLYGVSLGGAVMMNAIGSGLEYDRALIDSSPSQFSNYGCPKKIDPIKHLPEDASKLFVITGKHDQVLGEEMTGPLRVEAEKRNAKVLNGEFAHPYMDSDFDAHQKRMLATFNFFFEAQTD